MLEWTAQWYAYVPAFEKVWLNVAPPARDLLSNEPSSAVTVCVVVSPFDHVTVDPTATVIEPGLKAKPLIATALPAAAGAAADDGAAAGDAAAAAAALDDP